MQKYYHFTSYENLEDINKYGLVSKNGERTRTIGDNRCAIFLSQGIQNAILMYSNILHHYNCHSGDLGLKALEYYKNKIEHYNKSAQLIPLDEEDHAELEAIKQAIDWITEIMSYKDFSEYMGDGVYLSISNVEDVVNTDPNDCYTTKNISAGKISVVVLRNKETGAIIDSRESVLTYFMSTTPIENIIDNTNNVIVMKNIKDLYQNRLKDINYYNKNNFEIEEIPIKQYIEKSEKVKSK